MEERINRGDRERVRRNQRDQETREQKKITDKKETDAFSNTQKSKNCM